MILSTMKQSFPFTPDQRMQGISALRAAYNLPRNRMISGAELLREIESLKRKRATGSCDDVSERLAATFEVIGLIGA